MISFLTFKHMHFAGGNTKEESASNIPRNWRLVRDLGNGGGWGLERGDQGGMVESLIVSALKKSFPFSLWIILLL